MLVYSLLRRSALAGFAALSLTAAESPAATNEELQRQIEELRTLYEVRLAELEARIDELEAERSAARSTGDAEAAGGDSERDELLAAADAVTEEAEAEPGPVPDPQPGKERDLNRFNPEISFTGDVVAANEAGENDISAREFELDFQSVLDPFSYTKWTLAFSEEEGVEIEEGYIGYTGIAPGLTVRAGKMRQSFGVLNRWHLHALPQPEYPLVLETYLGEEGLVQTGFSAEWLLPRPWASANELVVQVTDGSAEPFGGESFDDLTALAHLKNFWDLSDASYLEWGLTGAVGTPDGLESTRIWGTDLTFHWQPPGRGKYREVTWRSEALLSERDDGTGVRREAWGGYSYLEGLVRRNLYVGARYDWLEDPLEPDLDLWAFEPYVSWWQSEYVRLRAAYRLLHDPVFDDEDGRFLFQITWAAGPHKHETY